MDERKPAKGDKGMKRPVLFSYWLVLAAAQLMPQQRDFPKLTNDDILIHKDIVYRIANGHELKLDIAVPRDLNSPAPAIVDFPGGAWRICNKSVDDARFYAEHGFIGVSVEYRTSDIAVFPAAVHDCKAAIRWLRAHAEKYDINPNKIGVTGISAGGHLAALLGTSGDDIFLEGQGDDSEYSSRVQAVVDHFGPIDFLAKDDATGLGLKHMNNLPPAETPEALFLGGPVREKRELARLANPMTYIDPADPPTFIGHGEKDGMVIIRQSERFFEALKRAGVPAEFVRVKNADHQYRPYQWDAKVDPSVAELTEMTMRWFEKWLGAPNLDRDAIRKSQKERKPPDRLKTYRLYYQLTIDLPGKTKESSSKGKFALLCEGKVLAEGEMLLSDLSTGEGRTFKKALSISGVDLQNKEIMWNFRGEIFDSQLSEKFEPMYMQGEMFDDSIEGVGFTIQISADKSFRIEKAVYRKISK
jgi:acetyl esterase/lipase